MREFFSFQGKASFIFFGWAHLIPIFIAMIIILFLYIFSKSIRVYKHERMIRIIYGTILLINEGSIYIWRYFMHDLTIGHLPFELCSYTMPLTVLLLYTKSKKIYDITYFWGIGGGLMALLTPTLTASYDNYRYYQFMIGHTTIVMTSFYMLWVHQMIPNLKSFIKSFAFLIIAGIYAIIFNTLFHTNYMGLAGSLGEKTIIDYLGPYPYNIASMALLAFVMYILLYLPIHFVYHRKP